MLCQHVPCVVARQCRHSIPSYPPALEVSTDFTLHFKPISIRRPTLHRGILVYAQLKTAERISLIPTPQTRSHVLSNPPPGLLCPHFEQSSRLWLEVCTSETEWSLKTIP